MLVNGNNTRTFLLFLRVVDWYNIPFICNSFPSTSDCVFFFLCNLIFDSDASTGKPYWHNASNGQTTWDNPIATGSVLQVKSPTPVFLDTKGEYAPISPPNAPVIMTWSNVSVYTLSRLQVSQGFQMSKEKALLNNISGCITGGLWGIMGPSGGGKTTLLSVLSLRLDTQRMRVVGDVVINGQKYTKNTLKNMSGYVMQDDLVMATLTVYETLMYTAALRMPRYNSLADRQARVEEVMKLMGIEYTRDVIVGDSRNKGISGGERKRLCVAMELLPKPMLLFLDEPTSGLDSTTALNLMSALKDLSARGECTIICTIHQPQTKIYNLIDNLILMRKGEIVYQGPIAKAEQYMAAAGYPCPDRTNPADHLLDVVILGSEMNEGKTENVKNLMVPIDLDMGLSKENFRPRAFPYWFWQFFTLVHRNVADRLRRWDIFATNLAVSLIIGTFIACGGWYNIANNPDPVGVTTLPDQFGRSINIGTRNTQYIEINAPFSKINAIQFFTVIHQGVISSLQGTHAFPVERALMLRERQSGSYFCSAYFLAKISTDSFFQLIAPITFTAVTYPVIGLSTISYSTPGIYLGFQMLLSNSAVALSNMCSCWAVSIEMSTVVLAMFMEITRLYSAFFISPLALDAYPIWSFWDQTSYMKFAYTGLCLTQYQGMSYYCTPAQLSNINFVRVGAANANGVVTIPTMPIDPNNAKERAAFPGLMKPYCKYSSGNWCPTVNNPNLMLPTGRVNADGSAIMGPANAPLYSSPSCTAVGPGCTIVSPCQFYAGGYNLPSSNNASYVSTYKVPNGEAVMATFGYGRYTTSYCGGILIVYIIVCRIASYVALRLIKV